MKQRPRSLTGTAQEHDTRVREMLTRFDDHYARTINAKSRHDCRRAFRSFTSTAEAFGNLWTNYLQGPTTHFKLVHAAKNRLLNLEAVMSADCIVARRS